MNSYPLKVEEALQQAKTYRLSDPDQVLSAVGILREYAKRTMDKLITARADYYQASACYMLGDMDTSRYFAKQAYEYFDLAQMYENAGYSRNMMGLIACKKGDYADALTCFFDIVHLSDKYSLKNLKTFGLMNLADLCIQFEDWRDALDYFIASERNMDQYDDKDPRKPYFYLAACVQGMSVANRLGDEDALNSQLSKAHWILKKYPEASNNLEMSVFRAMQATLNKDTEKLKEACAEYIAAYRSVPERLDYTSETMEILYTSRENGFDDLFEQLIAILTEENFAAQGYALALQVSRMKLDYLEEKGKTEEFNQELRRSRIYYENFFDCVNPSLIALFRTQSRLYSSENVNAQLQAIADTDDLTGLGNRRFFNEEADRFFSEASRRGCCLSAEILDIDDFKHINDTYGHITGDHVLVFLFRILHALDDTDVFAARYGGDEFVIMALDHTDEQLQAMAEAIQASIREGSEDMDIPAFTVSQGIVNHKVQPENQIWDYTSAADSALYAGKHAGKNCITLIHHKKDLSASEQHTSCTIRKQP